ncbi:MAG: bifunctional DNA-formamidopyrimidine glycosylase/DNA-(apurinic or apyrimidinic site) lyase [Candidatus Binatia bacterium]|nr:bifunctional DNA-formamidopyrimidine glycosylase/DNA-(apurinic or apyrimidinic site) lyase [Candidatus Binatia bacterium]
MPELPEVETIRRSLERFLLGQTVARVEVREPRLRQPVAPGFAQLLTGRTIQQTKRRGKYLLFGLDNQLVWLVHLGMTGRLIVDEANGVLVPHDHILVFLQNNRRLRYHDPRRFGLMAVGAERDLTARLGLGVEPLSSDLTVDYLWTKTQRSRRTIKDLLMDQGVIAGIGNIYASEILFRAGVWPFRPAETLGVEALGRIVRATKTVLREAIRCRGSSISDFRDGEGNPGSFQARLCVYDRAGLPCRRCRTPIQRETHGGRSAYWCPHCQR